MIVPRRKMIILDLLRRGPVLEERTRFNGIDFEIIEHRIGWHFDLAEDLIRKYDGYVDGISISGLQKRLSAGKRHFVHPGYLRLIRAANKTPVYLADDIRHLFAEWTLQKLLREQPQFFFDRKVLFHVAVAHPALEKISAAGAHVSGSDALVLLGTPKLLRGMRQIGTFLRFAKFTRKIYGLHKTNHRNTALHTEGHQRLHDWIRGSDIIVSFGTLLEQLDRFDSFEDKFLIVDFLGEKARRLLQANKNTRVISFIPEQPEIRQFERKHFCLLTGLLDQSRLAEKSPLSFDEYVLNWIQDINLRPNRLRSTKGLVRRCAFIVHPLSQHDLWKEPRISLLANAPKDFRNLLEAGAARFPAFRYGTIKGVVSQATGQEVVCDLYAMPATPRQLLSMNPDFVYRRMVEVAKNAQKRGASMIGLGAYTKVVGDAGVTVARRSPIPVTNGNSYSAATTLWAARVMLEKMGSTSRKAMVIGATGGIGRVSSLLVSHDVDDIVLVATRPDKLLELRQEVLEVNPKVRVRVTTNANSELHDTDLIVTATSNQSGKILDIERVKPGAVICDCSRPLDIGREEAEKRPDVMVIESGEVLLPGDVRISCDIGLPKPSVYACLAETILLTLEGRFESFSLSKQLSMDRVTEIHRIGMKHGARLSEICGPSGVVTDEQIVRCRALAAERLKTWGKADSKAARPGLTTQISGLAPESESGSPQPCEVSGDSG